MRLRSQGLSDAEIGARVGLHAKSVARIVARQLDRARETRPFMSIWRQAAE